jgi:hypothetical protein
MMGAIAVVSWLFHNGGRDRIVDVRIVLWSVVLCFKDPRKDSAAKVKCCLCCPSGKGIIDVMYGRHGANDSTASTPYPFRWLHGDSWHWSAVFKEVLSPEQPIHFRGNM